MIITAGAVSSYIEGMLPRRDKALAEMEAVARRKDFPIIGPMVGSLLRQLAFATGAKSIFEMGSGYGYSAYWFAGGMAPDGKIICTDGSAGNRERALTYLRRGGFEKMIDFRVGDALEIIRQFEGPFDIILNDIDKKGYPEAFDLAIPRLRRGGIFITDNVLWSGRILHKKLTPESKAIREFNRKLFKSTDVISSIIPIRDGLGIAVKI